MRPVPDGNGRYSLVPVDDQFFPSWKAARRAANDRGDDEPPVVTQAILVDATGSIVWPIVQVVTRCHWRVAPQATYARRPKGEKPPERPPQAPRAPRRERTTDKPIGLDPRTRDRLRLILRRDPGFGRTAPQGR